MKFTIAKLSHTNAEINSKKINKQHKTEVKSEI